jgi:PAS domain S-box-containing protein
MRVSAMDVRRALDGDEFLPFFQPMVELRSGRLTGFEILARWRHPLSAQVPPKQFIAIAEKAGLIGQLTRQILRKAFESGSQMPAPLALSINISPVQLHDASLAAQIRNTAEAGGFPCNRLTIEITESGLVHDLQRAQKITAELKEMGCKLALDDFGMGFSSLRHLQALPFDVLKVDGSFVQCMSNAREIRKIVAAIVGLGHSLGLTTVAECVETADQAHTLLTLGCELGQGWLYGHPSPADQIPGMVTAEPLAAPTGASQRAVSTVVSGLEALPSQQLAQLQAIYDGAPVGLCFLDKNLRYVSINSRLAAMNDAPVAAHLGRSAKEMIPAFYPTVEPYLLKALGGEAIEELEVTRVAGKAGDADRTLLLSYQPALDEAGEVIGISVAAVDISARNLAEEALRESEDHLRFMVELNPEIPWVMDPLGNNLDVSTRWVKTTGISKEETRNLGWLAALHPDDVAVTLQTLRSALATGDSIDVEYRVKDIARGWRWMRSRGEPRFGPSGKILRWYGSVEDIDDRKQVESGLRTSSGNENGGRV